MTGTDKDKFRRMVLDHMDKGFLENIIDMCKHDAHVCEFIPDMIRDERIRVRLGGVALAEEMIKYDRTMLIQLIPMIALLLGSPNPTVRGDGAYLLSLINHPEAIPFLISAVGDSNAQVRDAVQEAIATIKKGAQ